MPHRDKNITLPLDMSLAPRVIFFFGMSGAGKSYVGDIIGAYNKNSYVYHADEDITQEMKEALAQKQPFTDQMRMTFFEIIVQKIRELIKQHEQVIITQGAYKQKHRDYLAREIPGIELVWVDASQDIIHQRLMQRADGISIESADALVKDFEEPPTLTKPIINTRDGNFIIEQLNYYYSDHKDYLRKIG